MKTKRTVITLIVCTLLLLSATVISTLALFSTSETVSNTYSVANVRITLDEARVNSVGQPIDSAGDTVYELCEAERVYSNAFYLVPGYTYTKDPTITVLQGSHDCYIRLLVTVSKPDVLDQMFSDSFHTLLVGYDASIWPCVEVKDDAADMRTYIYQYYDTVTSNEADTVLPPLFTGITVPGELSGEQLTKLEGFEIHIIGQAHIDPAGFDHLDVP